MDHLTDAQFTAFRVRSLEPGDLLELDDHLRVCSDCRHKLLALHAGGIPSFLAAAGSGHPAYAELEAYADGRSACDRARVRLHLRICPQCKAGIDGLERFRDRPQRPQ